MDSILTTAHPLTENDSAVLQLGFRSQWISMPSTPCTHGRSRTFVDQPYFHRCDWKADIVRLSFYSYEIIFVKSLLRSEYTNWTACTQNRKDLQKPPCNHNEKFMEATDHTTSELAMHRTLQCTGSEREFEKAATNGGQTVNVLCNIRRQKNSAQIEIFSVAANYDFEHNTATTVFEWIV